MSDFKAKMHQNPILVVGELTTPPDLAAFKGGYF